MFQKRGIFTENDTSSRTRESFALSVVCGQETGHLVPTWQDLEVLESINKALAPLEIYCLGRNMSHFQH